MNTATPTKIVDLKQNIFASGICRPTSLEPLVAVYPQPEMEKEYHLIIHCYLPDGTTPFLNKDFSVIKRERTEAGLLNIRQIEISYESGNTNEDITYSLWMIDATYAINNGPEAQAIRVQFIVGDPETSRGTVTSVART